MTVQPYRPGECSGCGKRFNSSDVIESNLTNTPDGEVIIRRYWHRECWVRHVMRARSK